MAEDLEEGEVGAVLRRRREGLDLRRLEEFGEEVGVGCGGGAGDQVGCLAGGCG